MKFKRIELYGFKSFADKHEIPFGSGITAIVGPNGCGKSNVADSIRWVLGEQSAKLLRGSSMQDVIFNGTEKRKSMSYCEVALVFDNREKLFPTLDYDEVVISRKLYRSGESEYALNRTPCRLKDITELLRDAGMGREGYSIIGQGRIDELLSSKPEDRRQIFEEAAGISKFKARKVDAERKLGRTRENLTRIVDILEEKQKQLEPLNRQAENARKWLDMRDQLRHHEINTYIHQYETASQAKEVINTRLDGVSEAIDLKQRAYDGAVNTYNESMYDLNSIDRNINALREELLTLTVGLEKQAGDMKVLQERLAALFSSNSRLKDENVALSAEKTETKEKLEKTRELEKQDSERLDLAYKEVDDIRGDYLAAVEKITQGENNAQLSKQSLMEAMDKLSDVKANMSALLAEREALLSSIAELDKRIGDGTSSLDADRQMFTQLATELSALYEKKDALAGKIKNLYEKNNELLAIASDTTSKLDKLNEKFFTASSRRKILKEMQQAFEGFAYSIRNLMNDAKKNVELSSRIEGVVAQLITVDAKFETAIETALGASMQNIVTRNEEDAKYIIEYLKKMRYGRVTFLPITSIKERSIDYRYESALKVSGCFGVASDLVTCDEKFRSVIRGLLGGTVIVDNLDTAVTISRKTGYALKIVTLEGDVINPSGAITGGSKKNDIANIFSHERELKELETLVDKLSADIDTLNARKEKCAESLDEVSAKIKASQAELHDCDVIIATKTEAKTKIETDIDEKEANLGLIVAERDNKKTRADKITADISSVSELEALITSKKESAKEDEENRQAEFDELKARRDSLAEKLTAARVAAAELEALVKGYETNIEQMSASIATIDGKIDANENEIAENDKRIQTIERELKSDRQINDSADAERIKVVREKLEHLDEYKESLQEKVSTVDKNRIDLMNELQTLREQKAREEMLLLKVDTDIEQMEQRILEEYELGYEQCLEYREEGYDVEVGVKETNRLKRAMNALGHVNVEAIEMSKIVAEEYETLDSQRVDLEKAEGDLLKIIEELSGEMLSRFSDKFERIRVNFIKIFKELFNGGNADLELLDCENPLEAGIEIKAQPPEKKLQSISLLSGGEKALTAIAILFAILKLNPMPFCLLDEIEAALDDANANRFAKYLRRFSQNTQFIVITHRKPTMELADSLYGVTMEEKGVSKIVSVKLEDAVAVAEKA